ncbi:MAG: class I SAM-dependent methyltransferase [Chitinophagales bacterium]|nr:class I SAM-dependent methyltransferase [Chitinophagales bacterium]
MTGPLQAQKDFYDRYWQGMQPLGSYKLNRAKWIMDKLLMVRKKSAGAALKLLDLGCGDGRLVPLWQAITGAEAHGLDLSPGAMQVAGQLYPGIIYKDGDGTQTGYPANSFDIIICQEVLEHIEEQEMLIDECSRILKHDGWLILTTPNKFYFDRRKGGNYSEQPIENIIDKKALLQLLSAHFEVLSYETLVYAKGDLGIYQLLTNRYLLAILRRFAMEQTWKNKLLRKGYGLHMAVVCRRKTRS